MGEYRIRYRDPNGRDMDSLPKPTLAEAIRHALVLELHHCAVLAIIGPEGEVTRAEVETLDERHS